MLRKAVPHLYGYRCIRYRRCLYNRGAETASRRFIEGRGKQQIGQEIAVTAGRAKRGDTLAVFWFP